MDKKKITFIIVTWNNEDTIKGCLDSLYRFCRNFKVIIIDNDSKDNTAKVVKAGHYEDCVFCNTHKNLGFAGGNNMALPMVETKYICYLNPDTILLEDIIEPSLEVLRKKENVGLVGCKLLNKDSSLQPSTFRFLSANNIRATNYRFAKIFPNFIKEKYFPDFSKSKHSKYVDWVIGAEMILETADAQKIGGFSTEYYMYTEDMDLCKKIDAQLGKRCYYLADISLIHLGGVSEAKNVNYNKMKVLLRNGLIFADKFYDKRKRRRIFRATLHSYQVRLALTKMAFFAPQIWRQHYMEKMRQGLKFCRELEAEMEI